MSVCVCVCVVLYRNNAIGEDILCFTVKARLQVLPTKYNLALWYPNTHHPHWIMHSNPNQHLESIAHIVNGCSKYKELYTARHDRIVDLISSLEVACVYDLYMDIVFLDKLTKYQPISFRSVGYDWQDLVRDNQNN